MARRGSLRAEGSQNRAPGFIGGNMFTAPGIDVLGLDSEVFVQLLV